MAKQSRGTTAPAVSVSRYVRRDPGGSDTDILTPRYAACGGRMTVVPQSTHRLALRHQLWISTRSPARVRGGPAPNPERRDLAQPIEELGDTALAGQAARTPDTPQEHRIGICPDPHGGLRRAQQARLPAVVTEAPVPVQAAAKARRPYTRTAGRDTGRTTTSLPVMSPHRPRTAAATTWCSASRSGGLAM